MLMEKVFNAYIHSLASKRENVSTFYEREKRLGRRFAPVCFQYWSFIWIDAITKPNVFILPTLCQGPIKLAFGGGHICEHKWFNKKVMTQFNSLCHIRKFSLQNINRYSHTANTYLIYFIWRSLIEFNWKIAVLT